MAKGFYLFNLNLTQILKKYKKVPKIWRLQKNALPL